MASWILAFIIVYFGWPLITGKPWSWQNGSSSSSSRKYNSTPGDDLDDDIMDFSMMDDITNDK